MTDWEKGGEVVNANERTTVELDREHYEKLQVILALWRRQSPETYDSMEVIVWRYIDDTWDQLGDFIGMDFTLQDFKSISNLVSSPAS